MCIVVTQIINYTHFAGLQMCMQNDNLVGNVRLGKWHVGEVRRYHICVGNVRLACTV